MDATFVWKLAKLGRLGSQRIRYDDDFIDRLNYQVTGVLLFLFIGIIGIRQYVGKPIQCWSPQEFTRGWEEYAENYCWVANTYYAPLKQRLPGKSHRENATISYYQWSWIFMGVQALLFYLPCLTWRGLYPQSRLNVRRVVQMAAAATEIMLPITEKGSSSSSNSAHSSTVRFLAKYIDSCIRRRHTGGTRFRNKKLNNSSSSGANPVFPKQATITPSGVGNEHGDRPKCFTCCGHRAGNCLACSYLLVKFLYLSNAIFQIYLMEVFIGTKYIFYGVYILADLIKGNHWTESGHFPRVTFCDFEAKKLGKNHIYTLQCVLPINMILEKVFIILWFWVSFLALINLASLLSWCTHLSLSRNRVSFVRKHLHIAGSSNINGNHHSALLPTERPLIRTFVEQYLGADVVFILRLISTNSCEFVASQLVSEMWLIFRHRRYTELEEMKSIVSGGGMAGGGGGGSTVGGMGGVGGGPSAPSRGGPGSGIGGKLDSPAATGTGSTHKSKLSGVYLGNSNRCVPLPSGITHDDIV